MDNFNANLIFDLAAGLLPEAEARAAEASLTSEGRAELGAQRAVLAAIAAAPPVAMTDIERAHLHRSVAAAMADTTLELSPAQVAAPPPRPRSRKSVVWLRWASAATVAAMFVGVVAVGTQLGSLGGSDSGDATSETIAPTAAGAARATTVAAGGDALLGTDLGDGEELTPADPPDTATTTNTEAAGLSNQLLEAPTLLQTEEKSDLDEVSAWLFETRRDRSSLDEVEDITALPCFSVAVEDDDLEIVDGFTVPYPGPQGEELTGIGFADAGTATAEPLIRIYDILTCERIVSSTD